MKRAIPTLLIAALYGVWGGHCIADEQSTEVRVCAIQGPGCDHHGLIALQRAVDEAPQGATIMLSSGEHIVSSARDVAYADIVVRSGLLISGKNLTIRGTVGTIVRTTADQPGSTVVVHEGTLELSSVTIHAAPPMSSEDDIYDGHGIFLVNARAKLKDVVVSGVQKMALSLRGESHLVANGIQLLNGHVGVWVEENAEVDLRNCIIANNDSAGVAVYQYGRAHLANCVLENNEDDGLYADQNASIEARDIVFIRNFPYAVRAVEAARASVEQSVFYSNAADVNNQLNTSVERSHSLRLSTSGTSQGG